LAMPVHLVEVRSAANFALSNFVVSAGFIIGWYQVNND